MNLICLIRGLWRSFLVGDFVSGHNYREIYFTPNIQILKCTICNYTSVGTKEY